MADKTGKISAEQDGEELKVCMSLVLWSKGVARKTHGIILTPERARSLVPMTYENTKEKYSD